MGPGKPASTAGIGTFKGTANDELPESEMLRVSVADQQLSLSVADGSINAARQARRSGTTYRTSYRA
jgi:hypothetical protein